jgi:CRISPR-associated endonuclease Cas3-HD
MPKKMQKQRKQQKKDNQKQDKAITSAEALAALERAFCSGDPTEVEWQLREMLQVQVAVVGSIEEAKGWLAQRKHLLTVPAPYGVFLEKSSGFEVYQIDWRAVKERDFDNAIKKADREDILPNQTYLLLQDQSGYFPDKGLTFSGRGETTGAEDLPAAEQREKFTEGKFQTWEEHARGVWEKARQLTNFYRPFIEAWAEAVFKEQWEKDAQKKNHFLEALIWALQVAVLFHDIGKFNQKWQNVVWEIEQRISGKVRQEFVARTSHVPEEKRKFLPSPPLHAPFAYPFIRTFLRKLLGDYRFLDAIALATVRHHSLEVSGSVTKGSFRPASDDLTDKLNQSISCLMGDLSDEERSKLREALTEAAKATMEGSEMDEPPSPSDDFYFIYCLANRLVKVCDWEDAGDKIIELREVRCRDAFTNADSA